MTDNPDRRAEDARGPLEQGVRDLAQASAAQQTARHARLEDAARQVVKVYDGGPRAYDVEDWDAAVDDLRRALEPEEPVG